MNQTLPETFKSTKVTYTVELNGKLYVIENVPARVSDQTGEQFFAPATVEKIHRIVKSGVAPIRTLAVDVFEFAA